MSSRDTGEILLLKPRGNEYARKVWLGNAPNVGEGGRPKEGDDINVFKRFIVECYENKRYYREPVEGDSYGEKNEKASSGGVGARQPTSRVQSAGRTITSHKPNVALQHNNGFSAAPPRAAAAETMKAPQQSVAATPAPEVDLLDFGAFDSAPLSTNVPNANVLSTVATTATADPFDPFNSNPTSTTTTTSNSSLMQEAPTNQTGGGFDDSFFDPFGTMQTTSTANASAPTASKPIMNNNNSFGIMNGGMQNNNMMQGGGMNTNMNGMNNNMMNNNFVMNGTGGMQNNMMNNPMMMQNNNQMMPNTMNGMPHPMMSNMMSGMGSNNTMMNSNMGMMQGNNMMSNNMAMHGTMGNNNMMNGTMGLSGIAPQKQAMNMNIMQPMNNSISNNFGSKPANGDSGKKDPFAGLGF